LIGVGVIVLISIVAFVVLVRIWHSERAMSPPPAAAYS
jgi:hypothetical protein